MNQLKNSFIIVVPAFNAEQSIVQALNSIVDQEYEDLGIIIKDDISEDNTSLLLMDYFNIKFNGAQCFKFNGRDILWIRNKVKMFGGGNTYDAVINHTSNANSIIGVVDGDDYLLCPNALKKIKQIYDEHDKWLVWSQHRLSSGEPGYSSELPADEFIYESRDYWAVSHFRTCRSWLFQHLDYRDLADPFIPGSYMRIACDAALLYPIIELCGNKKSYFLNEILYQYNDHLPSNEARLYEEQVPIYTSYVMNSGNRYARLASDEIFPRL